jgi:type IV pilus secretin PilQ/predicted competence protein
MLTCLVQLAVTGCSTIPNPSLSNDSPLLAATELTSAAPLPVAGVPDALLMASGNTSLPPESKSNPAPVLVDADEGQDSVEITSPDIDDQESGRELAPVRNIPFGEVTSSPVEQPDRMAPDASQTSTAAETAKQDNGEPSNAPISVDAKSKLAGDSPIHLHLENLEIRQALELLSREGPYNILVSNEVQGTISGNLDGLSFDKALAAILKLGNLVAQREDNLIYVYPADAYKRMQEDNQQVLTKVYHLRYLRGTDFQEICAPFLTPTVGKMSITPASEIGIASDTAAVGGDSMSGGEAVVVQDYEAALLAIDKIVTQLDIQPTQVLIEAVIMEVTLENSHDLGTNFAVLGHKDGMLALAGNALAINGGAGFDPAQLLTATGQIAGNANGFLSDTNGIKFGFIDKDVTGFIRALNTCGRTNILASPRILVLNKQRAELIIGEKIGYKTLAITETSSVERVEFLSVGTQLRLRPFVVENGLIRLEVHPERSSGFIKDGIPQTSTSEVTTNVMVPDGSTIVIGGLMEDKEEVHHSGIPGLMEIPWLGALFRREFTAKSKKELVVLLTPRTFRPPPPAMPSAGGQESVIKTSRQASRPTDSPGTPSQIATQK